MDIRDIPLPVTVKSVETHNIIDTTKLNCFQGCPREFFFTYILGWRPDTPNIHLEFGSAFHLGLEHLLRNHCDRGMDDPKVINEAFELFYEYYRQHFAPEDDEYNAPKDPGSCLQAFTAYATRYGETDRDMKVLYTEIAGSVPVSEDITVHFKMDSIIERPDGIESIDHKTASKETKNMGDEFLVGLQPGTYCHALYSLYPADLVNGVVFNYIILRKKGPGFVRKRIKKSLDQMQVYIFNVKRLVSEIVFYHKILADTSPDDDILEAFPMRTNNCTKWGRTCSFMPFCEGQNNPLSRCDSVPLGFKEEHWNPRKLVDDARYEFKNGKLIEHEREENAGRTGHQAGTKEDAGDVQGKPADGENPRTNFGGKGGWQDSYFKDMP